MLGPDQLFFLLRAAPGAAGSHTPGERGSTPRPATTFRAARAGYDTRTARVASGATTAGSPSPIGGAARTFALDVSEPDEVPVPGTQAACPRRNHSAQGRMKGVGRVQDPQGEGPLRWIGVVVGILSHAILIAVVLVLGVTAAALAAALLGYLFVVTPGNPRGRR